MVAFLFRNFNSSKVNFSNITHKIADLFIVKKNAPICYTKYIDVLVDIGILITLFQPEIGTRLFILDLITIDKSPEQQIIGMLIFNCIADLQHITFDKEYVSLPRKPDFITQLPTIRYFSIESLKCTYFKDDTIISPEHLLSFRHCLEQLISWLDPIVCGPSTIIQASNHNSTICDVISKDKLPLVDVFRTILSSISRVPPANLKMSQLIELLVSKCFHIDLGIIKESKKLLISCMKYRSVLRIEITECMAKFILAFSEDNAIAIRFGLNFLQELFSYWRDMDYLFYPDSDTQYIDIDIRKRTVFCASLYEGVALILLCSTYIGIRRDAIKLLDSVRTLNKELPPSIAEPGIRLLNVIERYAESITFYDEDPIIAILDRSTVPSSYNTSDGGDDSSASILSFINSSSARYIATSASTLYNNRYNILNSNDSLLPFRELAMDNSNDMRWTNCLGKLIHRCHVKCPRSVAIAFSLVCPFLERLTQFFLPQSFRTEKLRLSNTSKSFADTLLQTAYKSENIVLWRNFVLLALSIGGGDETIFAARAGLLSGKV